MLGAGCGAGKPEHRIQVVAEVVELGVHRLKEFARVGPRLNGDDVQGRLEAPRLALDSLTKLAASQLEQRPDLEAFPFELAAWAEAETRAAILRLYIDFVGMLDEEAKPRDSMLKWLLSFERLAAERRRSLGLDPRSSSEVPN